MVLPKNSKPTKQHSFTLWLIGLLGLVAGFIALAFALAFVFTNSPVLNFQHFFNLGTNDSAGNSPSAAENLNTTMNSSGNTSTENGEDTGDNENIDKATPNELLLPVPFTPQAPSANWDELHNEACEEASAIMAHTYFAGNTEKLLESAYVEQEIDKLTAWQTDNLGYYLDATSQETAHMIEQVYNLKTEVVPFPTLEQIKYQLASGNLVIVSANGRKLFNPNFKQPGPIHHMLVLVGYDANSIITNDPGTKRGQSYKYSYSTLKTASADWDHDMHTVNDNIKLAIIVSKP